MHLLYCKNANVPGAVGPQGSLGCSCSNVRAFHPDGDDSLPSLLSLHERTGAPINASAFLHVQQSGKPPPYQMLQ